MGLHGRVATEAGYDSAPMLDSSGHPGPLAGALARLDLAGRPWRSGWLRLDLDLAERGLPAAESQGHRDGQLGLQARQQLLDALALLLQGDAGLDRWPSRNTLDLAHADGGAGLAFSPWEPLQLEALALLGVEDQPSYDLDQRWRGVKGRAGLELGRLRLDADWSSRWADYPERKLYLSITRLPSALPRADHLDEAGGRVGWETDGLAAGAGWRWSLQRSNANDVDLGPGQDVYHDNFIDNTLLPDFESWLRQGPVLDLAWQALPAWRLSWQGACQRSHYEGRLAKTQDDVFVPGRPRREDTLWDSRLASELGFTLWGQAWDLLLAWEHQDSQSNDAFFTYQRDLSRVELGLAF